MNQRAGVRPDEEFEMHSLLLVTEARRTDLIGDQHPAATEEDCVDELRLEWARAGHPRTCGHDPRRGRHLRCGVKCPPVNSGVQGSSAAAHLLASSSAFIVRAQHSRTAAYQTRRTGGPSRWGESAGVPVVAVSDREPVS